MNLDVSLDNRPLHVDHEIKIHVMLARTLAIPESRKCDMSNTCRISIKPVEIII